MINNFKTTEAISTDIIAEISQPFLKRDTGNIFLIQCLEFITRVLIITMCQCYLTS